MQVPPTYADPEGWSIIHGVTGVTLPTWCGSQGLNLTLHTLAFTSNTATLRSHRVLHTCGAESIRGVRGTAYTW